jgi:hypothetical protein
VKGKRRVKARQVPLTWESLNVGDVFIMDRGDRLFLWTGSKSNKMEQVKGLDIFMRMKAKDRVNRATIEQLAEDTDNMDWWTPLGGRHKVAAAETGGEDDVEWADIDDVLYK